MRTTFKILYLKDNILSELDENGDFIPFNSSDSEISDNYLLLLDDSYFFYLTPDIPAKNVRKLPVLVYNYLIANYPEDLIKNYHFIEKKGNILTYIISDELLKFLENNKPLFENASAIATPLMLIWNENQKKNFYDGNRFYSVESYKIEYIEPSDNIDTVKDVIKRINNLPDKSVEFQGISKDTGFTGKFKKSAIIFVIAYIFFVSGLFFHLFSEKKQLKKIDNAIMEIYKKAGVAGKSDPYGVLLYRASSHKEKSNFKVLPLFEIISVSIPSDTVLTSFYYKNKTFKIEGTTSDFLKIDEFKNNLKKSLKGEVFIGNTIKQHDKIKFTITCKISKLSF